jgi:hypothetical protein
LLDIHPQPRNSVIEFLTSGGLVRIGRLNEPNFFSTIRSVRKILSSAVADGLFVSEEQTEFEFLYHFDTVDEWVTYLEEEYSSDLDSNQGLIRRARRVLSGREGEVLMRECVRAVRLRRQG